MTRRLRVGLSTCPNDTFLFHGLLSGAVTVPGHALEFELLDVQQLNEALLRGELDVLKVSYAAALGAAEDVVVLPTGSALGYGVGPVLLASPAPAHDPPRVLCPGAHTTATLLWRLFHAERGEPEQVVFSDIVPALLARRADLGVCIHEARFTYEQHGLRLVEDLGERWERETGAPLPLGGIVARRALPGATRALVQEALAASLAHGRAHPEEALGTMRRHAQEHSDEVLWKHVELFVNEWTADLGAEGRRALEALERLGSARGLVATGARLEVLA